MNSATISMLLGIALVPSLLALSLFARASPQHWLNALLGASGWLAALVLRYPIAPLLRGLTPIPGALLAALIAGLLEESIRYAIVRYRIETFKSISSAAVLGLGWGLMEALAVYAFGLPIAERLGTPWHILVLGAIERNTATLFHVSMSILLASIPTSRGLAIAIALHTLLDAEAGLLSIAKLDTELIELVLALTSLSVFIAVLSYARHRLR